MPDLRVRLRQWPASDNQRRERRISRRTKKMQETLGDHHDAVVARDTAPDIGVRAHLAGETLWDLKARLLELPLAGLLGRARERVPAYGSGGLTSYDDKQTREQLYRWVEDDHIPR